MAHLEHVNITVPDADAVADTLVGLFDWRVRWAGAAMGTGRSVHVGTDDSYVALYSPGHALGEGSSSYATQAGLNHIGVVVDDIDAAEKRVADAGFTPHNHGDYEPGRRFYFDGPAGVEIEVVAYD